MDRKGIASTLLKGNASTLSVSFCKVPFEGTGSGGTFLPRFGWGGTGVLIDCAGKSGRRIKVNLQRPEAVSCACIPDVFSAVEFGSGSVSDKACSWSDSRDAGPDKGVSCSAELCCSRMVFAPCSPEE